MSLNIYLAKIFKLLTSPTKGKLSMPLVYKSRSSTLVSTLRSETSSSRPRDDLLGLGPRLDLMTYDILVDIFLYLDFYDFTSARLACRSLFRASDTLELWHALAYSFQAQYKILLLDKLTTPKSLPLADLKTVVCRSYHFSYNWGPLPESRSPKLLRRERYRLHGLCLRDYWPVASSYSTNDFSVVSLDHKLICIDFKTGGTVEEFQLGRSCHMVYIERDSKVFAAVTGKLQVEDGETHRLQVIQIQLPSVDRKGGVVFKRILDIEMLRLWTALSMHANAVARSISLLLWVGPGLSLKLFTLFDWDEADKFCVVDSGLFYDTRTFRQGFILRFSSNLEESILISTSDSGWEQRHFSIRKMKRLTMSHPSGPISMPSSVVPVEGTIKSATINLPEQPPGSDVMCRFSYAFEPNANSCAGIPPRYSYISLYAKYAIGAGVYILAQHYGDEDVPTTVRSFILELKDAVSGQYTTRGLPLVGLDFNHIVWMEKEVTSFSRTIHAPFVTLRMRMVKFPNPDDLTMAYSVKTLEGIDQSVLKKALRVSIESTMGAVLITTRTNELYRYRYA